MPLQTNQHKIRSKRKREPYRGVNKKWAIQERVRGLVYTVLWKDKGRNLLMPSPPMIQLRVYMVEGTLIFGGIFFPLKQKPH